jgi:hypothetical protein
MHVIAGSRNQVLPLQGLVSAVEPLLEIEKVPLRLKHQDTPQLPEPQRAPHIKLQPSLVVEPQAPTVCKEQYTQPVNARKYYTETMCCVQESLAVF